MEHSILMTNETVVQIAPFTSPGGWPQLHVLTSQNRIITLNDDGHVTRIINFT